MQTNWTFFSEDIKLNQITDMTVVNALIFSKHTGAMCCDEQTTIGDVRKMMSSDKIQKIVPTRIREEIKFEAVYGGTGTTAIGDEIRKGIKERLNKDFDEMRSHKEKHEQFKTIEDVFQIGYEEMTKVKHRHINDILKGYFDFDTGDYLQGYYRNASGEKIEVLQKDVKEKVYDLINWRNAPEVDSIFLNAAIIAGFDQSGEFRICKMSMKTEMTLMNSTSVFETVGSGSDSAQIIFSDFASNKTLEERRNHIDRVEGMIQLIRATNGAAKYNMGVGGYFNIILFDGNEDDPDKRFVEIFDSRSKLASEIVFAYYNHYISYENMYELINEIIFRNSISFEEMNRKFLEASTDRERMGRFLRGYKVH